MSDSDSGAYDPTARCAGTSPSLTRWGGKDLYPLFGTSTIARPLEFMRPAQSAACVPPPKKTSRRAVGCEGGVDGQTALGRELHALGADGALAARVLEEDVALVLAHHVARLRRIALQPVADGGPGRLLLRLKHAHLDQHVADRRVGPVVGAVEAEVDGAAFGELDAAAALDLDLEQRHRILHVGDLQALALQRTLLDLGARVEG